jgi:hypothetical protein
VTAFDIAAATLSRDANMSVAAVFCVLNKLPISTRVVLSAPDQFASMGVTGAIIANAVAMVTVADLSERPRAGDILKIGATEYEVMAARLDAEGSCWMLDLALQADASVASARLRAASA